MSLSQNRQEELFTADKELPDFLPTDDPMVVFSREIYPAFKDKDFAQYYSSKGRWVTSPACQWGFHRANSSELLEAMTAPEWRFLPAVFEVNSHTRR